MEIMVEMEYEEIDKLNEGLTIENYNLKVENFRLKKENRKLRYQLQLKDKHIRE